MTRRLAAFGLLTLIGTILSPISASAKLDPNDEYILLVGGPALLYWENYRREEHRHDRWWGNFVRAARLRIEQLQEATDDKINLTLLVYKPGYVTRAKEDGSPLISWVESVRDKFEVRLVWFERTDEIFNYVNRGQNRSQMKVSGFEYFGHSNKYCFVFDYSNAILGASNCFLHQRDLNQFDRKAFARGAYAKSWGCHSGEAFCAEFRRATGIKMIGAVGKTDYSEVGLRVLPFVSPGGRWTS
ncbi:MAG: hypothetical protein AAGA96_05130 [Verrucomicrobiota bacterium]